MDKLSRQRRRKLERKGIDAAEYKRLTVEIAEDAVSFVVAQYSAALALCLHDKLGFNKEKALKFMGEVQEIFDSVEKGYLSLEDITETVREELDIHISQG